MRSAAEVIAEAIRKAEDDAYLHGAWNSRPDLQPEDILSALEAAGYVIARLPAPDSLRYEGDEHEPADRDSWMAGAYGVAVWNPGEVQINHDGSLGEPVDSAIARDLGLALLAAADATERAL